MNEANKKSPFIKTKLMVLVSSLLLLTSCSFHGYELPYTKAIWVWGTEKIESEGDIILERFEKNHINTIYLSYNDKISDKVYKNFIKKASEKKMEVHALGGEPNWARDENEKAGKKFIEEVINLNKSAKPDERFAGIQLDVEPHLLDNWEDSKRTIMKEWIQNNGEFVELAHKGGIKKIGAAVTFWLDNEKTQKRAPEKFDKEFYKVLFDQFDYIAIMSYRDKLTGSNSIVSITKNEMKYAHKTRKPVVLGFNFNKGEAHTTYRDKGFKAAEKDMKKAGEIFKSNKGFDGVAIHDYNNWLPFYLHDNKE